MIGLIIFFVIYVIVGLAFLTLRVKDYKSKKNMQTKLNKFLLICQIFIYVLLIVLSAYIIYLKAR